MTIAKTSPSQTLTDLLFEKATVGLCLVAPDNTIVRTNAEWLRSTGFTEGQVVGENIVGLFPATRDMALAMHARARAGHRVEVPRHVQVINGRESWWEGSIDPVPMEGGIGLLITARWVSDAIVSAAHDLTTSTPTAEALKAAVERLAQDLDAMTRLHRLSTQFVRAEDLPRAVLEEIVDVAISITHADMGNIQLLDPASRRLKVAAHRGHEAWWLDFFESVAEGKGASCGTALQQGARAIVEDVATSPIFVGTPALEVQLRAGVRAVQSTPLYGSSGDLVGMISTHFRRPHRPDERDLRLLDLLARQAADLIERVRSEVALRESEERLRLAQQVARTGTFDWNIQSGVNTWTPELEAVYGLPPGGFDRTEAAFEKLVHPEDRDQVLRWAERALETGAPGEGEWRAVWPDGSIHWIAGRWQVLKDPSGKPVRMTGINMDITQRKAAERALSAKEAELELILDRTPFMLTRCSRDLRYRYVSAAYARMVGRTPEQVAGRPVVEIMGEEGFGTIRPHVEAVLRGELVEYEQEVRFPGVGLRRLQAIYVPDRDERGEVAGWIANIIDVTERRQAEALRVANEQLVEADRRRTEFLGMLSHELRNPLAPIRNSLYLLDHAEPTGQEAHRARAVINRQVGHLTRLVDDLLDVTRITRGKIELRRVELDLAALLRRTADDYRRLMQDRGLDLSVEVGDEPLVVNGDETRLAQVFGNLLSNAAKFTPAGGRVTIAAHTEEGNVAVRVRDTGPGIAPDVLPSIFEPFTQAKQTLARTEGGLGLGLALVRGLVSLHGGDVNAVNGSGAELIVRLPLSARRERQAAPPVGPVQAAAPVSHHHRVLVVDDNQDAAETLAEMVRMLGHDAEVVYDGPAAVRRAGEYHPDVVLCDLGLPGMDGYEVAHELRAARGSDVRLIAISGYAQPDDVTRAGEAGFDEHVAKPCGPEQIERLLT